MTLLELIAFNSFRPARHGHMLGDPEQTLPVNPPDLEHVRRTYFQRVERERVERQKRAESKRKRRKSGKRSDS